MVLYQKRNIPFIIRVLPAIFHPGLLILLALAAGLFYMAMREKSNVSIGMYIGVAVMLLFYGIAIVSTLRLIIKQTLLVETEYKALHLQQVRFNEVLDYHIPSANLDVETGTFSRRSRNSSSSRRTTAYFIYFRDSRDANFEILLRSEDENVIGQILEGIDAEKIIDLRAKEKEFLSNYKKTKTITKGFQILNYVFLIIVIGAVGYVAYQNRVTIKYWYNIFNTLRSPVADNWLVDSHGLKYNVVLVTDSTVNDNLTGQVGRWKYTPADADKKRDANLKIYGANGTFNEFKFLQITDSTAKLVGNVPEMNFALLSIGFGSVPPPDSLTKLILTFYPQVVPAQFDSVRSIVNALIPNSEGILPTQALIHTETQFAGILHNMDGFISYIAVYDLKTKNRVYFEELYRSEGCAASYEVVEKFGKPLIKQTVECEDSKPDISYFKIDESGKVSKTNR